MSDHITGTGMEFTPEEQLAAARAGNVLTRKYLNSFITQPLSWVAPDPRLTEITGGPKALNYVPFAGAPEQIAGLAANVSDALGNVRNYVTGNNTDWKVPGLATMRQMGENAAKTRAEMQAGIANVTPLEAPDPNNPVDRVADSLGSLSGLGAPSASSGVVRSITNLLPKAAAPIAHVLAPGTEGAAERLAVTGGLAAPLTAMNEGAAAADEARATEANAPSTQVAEASPRVASDTRPPIVQLGITEPKQTATQPLPVGISDAPTQADGPIDLGISDPASKQVPLQQQQGVGTIPIWGAIATLLGAGIAVRAGRAMHERNATVTDAARAERFNNPDYAAQAQDYNNERIARGGSEISSGTTTAKPPPLPEANYFRQGTNAINTALRDKNAQMQDAITTMGTPTTAENLAYRYGVVNNEMSYNTRLGSFLDTGYHVESGVQMPAMNRLLRRFESLPEDQQKIMQDGLASANELDNRTNNWARLGANQVRQNPPGPLDIRHDFRNQTDTELHMIRDRMTTDPILNKLAEDYWSVGRGMARAGEGIGFFPHSEAADLIAKHPHYTPEVDVTGKVLHPLGARDRTVATGVDQVNTKPWIAMAQHVEQLHRSFERNDLAHQVTESFLEAQRNNPASAKFIYEVPAPSDKNSYFTGGSFREPVVSIRTPTGTKFYRIDHPDVYNGLTQDSLKKQQVMSEAMTIPRRMYTWGTTGAGSLLTSRLQPLVNAAYSHLLIPLNAPKGTYGGLVHKAVMRTTGFDSSIARGIDTVTGLPGVGYSYGRGVFDRQAHHLASALDKGNDTYVNRLFRSTIGDLQTDKMQQALDDYFHNTKTAQMQQMGIGGMGIPARADLPALQILSDKRAGIMSANAVPEAFYGREWGGTKVFALKLNRAITETMSHISDASHDYWARLNWDNPNVTRDQFTYEARQLTGDPGVSGAAGATKLGNALMPYANISIQGTTRLGRAIAERPFGSMMTLASGLGTLAFIEMLTAMQSPAHMKHYEEELANSQHAGNIILYTDPDPTKYTLVSIPQEMRWAKVLVTNLIANAMNIIAMQHDPISLQSGQKMIMDWLGSHLSVATENQLKRSAADVTNTLNTPPIIGTFDHYRIMQGEGLWNSFRSPWSQETGNRQSLPNQIQDGALDDADGKMWTKVIGATLGMAGTALSTFNDATRYAKQTGSWVDGLGKAGYDWLYGAAGKNPIMNSVLEHPMRLSQQPPIIERTERDLKWMKAIGGSNQATLAEGYTSRGRSAQPVFPSTEQKIPTDPTMRFLWKTVEGANQRVSSQVQSITDLKKQQSSVSMQAMDPARKQAWMNDQSRKIADKYRFIQNVITDTNYTMSKAVNRNIHVGMHIDWQKGPEQFMDTD